MPAESFQPKLLSADAAIKASLHEDDSASLTAFGQALAWSGDNIAKPALNAGLIAPANIAAQAINAVSKRVDGRAVVVEPEPWQVPAAKFLSPAWFAQNVSSGLAMVVPFTLAGRATHGALGLASNSLKLEGAAAAVFASEKTAMIVGAGLYEGMKKPEAGQTRLSNALGGMAAFSVFEFGNPLIKNAAAPARIAGLMTVGAVGSTASLTTSELVANGKLPTGEQMASAALSGSVLNTVLPLAQRAVMRPFFESTPSKTALEKAGSASYEDIIKGVRRFQKVDFQTERELFKSLSKGQSPQVLFITCSDSRIDTHELTHTHPGDMFVLRNAGNLVPKYGDANGLGQAATIEYAVNALGVKHVIVAGHSHCGAMHGLMHPEKIGGLPAVGEWLKHASEARENAIAGGGNLGESALLHAATKENVLLQMRNLMSHPSVSQAVAEGKLNLHGWVYEIENGKVEHFAADTGKWKKL